MIDLLVIAGEHSGDNHAAFFVRQLKAHNPNLSICAVAGPSVQRAGAQLLFDLTKFSVVGLVETLRHYRIFSKLMHWLIEWVRVYHPKTICLVDFPGFNLLLAKKLFNAGLSLKSGGTTRICQYVSPQIWAWKPNRRFEMEKYIDHLGIIFPFEKQYFHDTQLDVQFVGHPLLQTKNPFTYDSSGSLLLLPGSRLSAIKRIYPILEDSFCQLRSLHPNLQAVVPVPSDDINKYFSTRKQEGIYFLPLKQIKKGFCAAIMSSGTASLQVALAGIPGVVTYKANPITFFIGKKLVKIPYLSIANILLKHPLYPEYLQNVPNQASIIALQMEALLTNPELSRQKYLEGARDINHILSCNQYQTVTDWLENYC